MPSTSPTRHPIARPPFTQRASGAAFASAALAALTLAAPASSQTPNPVKVQGLIGEIGSATWPLPASTPQNPYPFAGSPAAEIAQRDAKATLGKVLFWEEQVSIDNTMACGTCHFPEAGGSDARGSVPNGFGGRGSPGVLPQTFDASTFTIEYGSNLSTSPSVDPQVTARTAPSMIGAYVFELMFWDGGVAADYVDEQGATWGQWATAENVSIQAPVNGVEMGHEAMTWSSGVLQAKLGLARPMALVDPATLSGDFLDARTAGVHYGAWFDQTFAQDPNPGLAAAVGVTRDRFAAAIAHYLRTLVPDEAPIDLPPGAWDPTAPDWLPGFAVFNSKCSQCHSVAPFGLALDPAGGLVNRWNAPLSSGQFHAVSAAGGTAFTRVPSLRNVALRPYYFQDGSATTLLGAIEDEDVEHGIGLTAPEEDALVVFLEHALTDPRVRDAQPPFDRPELASERPEFVYEANEFGSAQSAVTSPEILANVPALMPHPGGLSHFRIGVGGATPGRPTRFLLSTTPTVIQVSPWIGANASGMATIAYTLPNSAATWAAGLTVTGWWNVFDPGMPGNLATSNRAAWTLFFL